MQVELAVLKKALLAAAAAPVATEKADSPPPAPAIELITDEVPPPEAASLPAVSAPTEVASPGFRDGGLQGLGMGTLLAFAAGSVGLLCASIPGVSLLAKPLSVIGLLVAIGTALAMARSAKVAVPAAVAVLCLLVVLFAGEWPWSRRSPPPPPPRLMAAVIPLGAGNPLPERALDPDEWVNAAENAIRRHDLRVQLVSATIGPVDLKRDDKTSQSKTKHLVFQLAVVCDGQRAPTLEYEPWADQRSEPSPNPPVLTDQNGGVVTQDTFDPAMKIVGRADKRLFQTGSQVREVLAYPAPRGEVRSYHLELPGSAYNLPGTFRFHIPRSMFQVAGQTPPQTQGKRP
jgi:hypothetical protein